MTSEGMKGERKTLTAVQPRPLKALYARTNTLASVLKNTTTQCGSALAEVVKILLHATKKNFLGSAIKKKKEECYSNAG